MKEDRLLLAILVRAIELALLEFERISYQKKADPEVINCLKLAIAKAKGGGR